MIMLAIMFLRRGLRDPLFYIAVLYFYFAFGPVINFLIGHPIYFGILQDRIPEATFIFMLALFGIFLISILIPAKSDLSNRVRDETEKHYFVLTVVLIVLIVYQLFVLLTIVPGTIGQSKIIQIARIGGGIHYPFLLLEFFVTPFFFLHRAKSARQLYYTNFALYVAYCLSFQERDFIFIILSILIYRFVFNSFNISRSRSLVGVLAISLPLVIVGTFLFNTRFDSTNNSLNLQGILNQGSLLFINTQIINLTETIQPFMYGQTYLNSLVNLIPNFIYSSDLQLLSWFKNIYAPTSSSGYGFALDAEAYLNFGYWGVIPFFIAISLVQRFAFNRIGRHPFYLYFSVFYTAFLPYAFRNDSLSLFKGSIYAIIFFNLIAFASWPVIRKYERLNHTRTTLQPDS
jgi:oligosaccharide repeat unit polymerase